MATMTVATNFYSEVCGKNGPTGEVVFVRAVELVDYGGNVLAGPFADYRKAAAAQSRYRTPTTFRAAKGQAYRVAGLTPAQNYGGRSIQCRSVSEDEVVTLPVANLDEAMRNAGT